MRSKTSNDNYYLLTMAAIAQEIRYRRGERKTDVVLAAGLPLASFGREKKGFREYLFRKEQPLRFRYEDESYEIRIQDVKLFPQGYSALALHPECVRDEPSVLLADIGGWTVDLMRLDNSVPNAAVPAFRRGEPCAECPKWRAERIHLPLSGCRICHDRWEEMEPSGICERDGEKRNHACPDGTVPGTGKGVRPI